MAGERSAIRLVFSSSVHSGALVTTAPIKLKLTQADQDLLQTIYRHAYGDGNCDDTGILLDNIHRYHRELPAELIDFVVDAKHRLDVPGWIVAGMPVSAGRATPSEIPVGLNMRTVEKEEFFHILISSLLGQIFTFDTIQNGNVVNHVFPISANADKPISSGFANSFDFHTEDAFHPGAGDYLGLLCMRNIDRAATTVAFLGDIPLDPDVMDALFEPRFLIEPNIAHTVTSAIHKRRAILFGSREAPYMRINFNLFDPSKHDADANRVFQTFREAAASARQSVVLEAGDLFFIDNLRSMHGRDPYAARFDGLDRWLIRLYLTTRWRDIAPYQATSGQFIIKGDVEDWEAFGNAA